MAAPDLIFQQIKKLEAVYGKTLTDEQVDVYVDLLSEYDFAHVWDAAQKHMRTSVYFPKPAELIGLIDTGKPRHETDYFNRREFLRSQELGAELDPNRWERLADEYEKLFSYHAEACRRRSRYYAANS